MLSGEGYVLYAAGCYGEVFLAFLYAFLLICTCYRMLETGRVGGVTGDGNVYALFHMIATPSVTSFAP